MHSIQHLALIMDGNGRWAKAQGRPRSEGHQRGAESVKEVVRGVHELKIPFLTLFAFSTLNWGRASEEVKELMDLLRRFLVEEEPEMIARGIRLRVIGEREMLPVDLKALLARVEKLTADGTQMTLTLAVSYDGRRDLIRAAQRLVSMAQRGDLLAADVQEETLLGQLSTSGMPDVDLVIRTSGERRLSGFLPFETCYAELIFLDKLWPDFTLNDLDEALKEYARRSRRFGLAHAQSDLQWSFG